jgi:outer membrane immunogenic protein
MRNSKFLISATVAISAIIGIGAASAADMAPRYTKAPIAPVMMYDWSGLYIGLNAGGGSSSKCWDLTNNLGVPVVPPAFEGCHTATGGTVGGQVGYRWQSQAWVFGLEAQGNWANFSGSGNNAVFQVTDHSKIDAFGTFTGQIGRSFNNVLLYVKGGAAVVSDKYSTVSTAVGFPGLGLTVDAASETRWGGVVGVGAEFGFARNWSVAFEYNHMFMGTRDVNAYGVGNPLLAAGVFSATDRIRQDVDLATVRVNYRWGGPVVAKY